MLVWQIVANLASGLLVFVQNCALEVVMAGNGETNGDEPILALGKHFSSVQF